MTKSAPSGHWIAADFHDRSLSAWLMHGTQAKKQAGLPASSDDLAETLASQIQQWDAAGADVLLSGAPGAGLQPVPAAAATAPSAGAGVLRNVLCLPGLQQAAPAGTLRSAPIRIAGFLAQNPNWDGVLCLPGETTHWVLVSADEIVSFSNFATVALARSAAAAAGLDGSGNSAGTGPLEDAVQDTLSRPERLAARQAELNASLELGMMRPAEAKLRLWGGWIGAELAAARPYWLGQNLALIGGGDLAALYAAALQTQGLTAPAHDGRAMALAGLTAAWQQQAG